VALRQMGYREVDPDWFASAFQSVTEYKEASHDEFREFVETYNTLHLEALWLSSRVATYNQMA
jgi:hypothetical protein